MTIDELIAVIDEALALNGRNVQFPVEVVSEIRTALGYAKHCNDLETARRIAPIQSDLSIDQHKAV